MNHIGSKTNLPAKSIGDLDELGKARLLELKRNPFKAVNITGWLQIVSDDFLD